VEKKRVEPECLTQNILPDTIHAGERRWGRKNIKIFEWLQPTSTHPRPEPMKREARKGQEGGESGPKVSIPASWEER